MRAILLLFVVTLATAGCVPDRYYDPYDRSSGSYGRSYEPYDRNRGPYGRAPEPYGGRRGAQPPPQVPDAPGGK